MNEQNKLLEKKLSEKTNSLENTQKELVRCKRELAKLKLKNEQPTVRSDLLNVRI